jgi:hypothetical protein
MKGNIRGASLVGPDVNCVSQEAKGEAPADGFKLAHGQFADIAIEISHEISPFDCRAVIARHCRKLDLCHEIDRDGCYTVGADDPGQYRRRRATAEGPAEPKMDDA